MYYYLIQLGQDRQAWFLDKQKYHNLKYIHKIPELIVLILDHKHLNKKMTNHWYYCQYWNHHGDPNVGL